MFREASTVSQTITISKQSKQNNLDRGELFPGFGSASPKELCLFICRPAGDVGVSGLSGDYHLPFLGKPVMSHPYEFADSNMTDLA